MLKEDVSGMSKTLSAVLIVLILVVVVFVVGGIVQEEGGIVGYATTAASKDVTPPNEPAPNELPYDMNIEYEYGSESMGEYIGQVDRSSWMRVGNRPALELCQNDKIFSCVYNNGGEYSLCEEELKKSIVNYLNYGKCDELELIIPDEVMNEILWIETTGEFLEEAGDVYNAETDSWRLTGVEQKLRDAGNDLDNLVDEPKGAIVCQDVGFEISGNVLNAKLINCKGRKVCDSSLEKGFTDCVLLR